LAQAGAMSPRSKQAMPKVAFGIRQVGHKEIRTLQDDLVKNYSVSPVKIRRAGLEEMQSLKNEEMLA